MDAKNSNNDSTICVNGDVTFTLCDCQNKGTVTHGMNGTAKYIGNGVWVECGNNAGKANFVLYSGSISGNEYDNASIKFGAGVHLGANANFTMHGGSISGNKTAGYGSAVYVQAGTTSFTMYGGTITSNSAGHDGGGVYAYSEGTVILSGAPVISENKDADGTMNNVYLDKSYDAYFGDETTFTIGDGGLSEGTSIGVTVDAVELPTEDNSYTTIAEAAEDYTITADDAKRVSADAGTGYSVRQKDNTLVLVKSELPHEHGGTSYTQALTSNSSNQLLVDGEAVATTEVTIPSYAEKTFYVLPAGNYYLESDVTLNHTLLINVEKVSICLNGKSFMAQTSEAAKSTEFHTIYVYNGGDLTVDDCKATGKITRTTKDTNGGGVVVAKNSKFTLNGGSISGNGINRNGQTYYTIGGGVYVNNSTFTMTGGKISDNKAFSGGVYLINAQFIMSGGIITGNDITANGGGVYNVSNSTLQVSGSAQITGNTNDSAANNILSSGGEVIVDGTLNVDAALGISTYYYGDIDNGTPLTVAKNVNAASAACFTSDKSNYKLKLYGDTLMLTNGKDHTHHVCGAATCTDHGEKVEWMPVGSESALNTALSSGASVYLTGNISLTSTVKGTLKL